MIGPVKQAAKGLDDWKRMADRDVSGRCGIAVGGLNSPPLNFDSDFRAAPPVISVDSEDAARMLLSAEENC